MGEDEDEDEESAGVMTGVSCIDNGAPVAFWFSGFFFQPSFMTGTLQNFARKYVFPIDSCTLEYIFQKEGLEERNWAKPEDGAYVYGLKMEGARFNRETMLMDESFPKTLYDEMPVGWLRPCKKTDVEHPRIMIARCTKRLIAEAF